MLKKGILLSEKKEMNFGHRYWKINVVLLIKINLYETIIRNYLNYNDTKYSRDACSQQLEWHSEKDRKLLI